MNSSARLWRQRTKLPSWHSCPTCWRLLGRSMQGGGSIILTTCSSVVYVATCSSVSNNYVAAGCQPQYWVVLVQCDCRRSMHGPPYQATFLWHQHDMVTHLHHLASMTMSTAQDAAHWLSVLHAQLPMAHSTHGLHSYSAFDKPPGLILVPLICGILWSNTTVHPLVPQLITGTGTLTHRYVIIKLRFNKVFKGDKHSHPLQLDSPPTAYSSAAYASHVPSPCVSVPPAPMSHGLALIHVPPPPSSPKCHLANMFLTLSTLTRAECH